MTQPYKSCPSCDMPAPLNAAQCLRCGHPFLAGVPFPGANPAGAAPPSSSFGPMGPAPFPPNAREMPPMPYAPIQYVLTPQEVNNKRITAAVVALLLGSLGIHKFIMGKTQAGIVMLLVSLMAGLFTCGLATTVMAVIGLVEGVMYLNKSDAEFYQTYLAGNREWF